MAAGVNPAETVRSFFICPIAQDEMMEDPVIDPCGHTFDRVQILGWLALGHNDCPLSRAPLTEAQLIPNRAVRDAIEALAHLPEVVAQNQPGTLQERIALLFPDADEQNLVQTAVNAINQQRERDLQQGTPIRLPEPQSFKDKVKAFYRS